MKTAETSHRVTEKLGCSSGEDAVEVNADTKCIQIIRHKSIDKEQYTVQSCNMM